MTMATADPRSSLSRKLLGLWPLTYLVPVVLLIWYIARYSVDVLFWDEWDLMPYFVALRDGGWSDLVLRRHNEHIIALPRLLIGALATASSLDMRWVMSANVLCALGTLLALSVLWRHSSPGWLEALVSLFTATLVLGVFQWESWLWAFQIAWFLVSLLLTLAVAAIFGADASSVRSRLVLSALACGMATLCSGQGLMTWWAVLPLFAALPGSGIGRIRRAAAWSGLSASVSLLFFLHSPRSPYEFNPASFVHDPWPGIRYALAVLGGVWSSSVSTAIGVGAAGLTLFGLSLAVAHRWAPARREATAWASLGLFSVLTAAMITLGRVGLGTEQALSSRYTTCTLLLWIAIAHLLRLGAAQGRVPRALLAGAIVVAGAIVFGPRMADAMRMGAYHARNRQVGRSCLEMAPFLRHSPSNDACLSRLYPDAEVVRRGGETLRRLEWGHLPLRISEKRNVERNIGHLDKPRSDTRNFIHRSGTLATAGWAVMPGSATVVFLTSGGSHEIFATVAPDLPSADVAAVLGPGDPEHARWIEEVPGSSLPAGESSIEAWLYDETRDRLLRLRGGASLVTEDH